MSHDKAFDIVIIGSGMVGLSLARQLKKKHASISILVVEKEKKIGSHSSGRNSGVLHAGIYYPEGSIKAKVCVKGALRLKSWAIKNGLKVGQYGKIIVAQNKSVECQINLLASRAKANGVKFSIIHSDEIKFRIPTINPKINIGIWSPNTCVVNPKEVMLKLSQELKECGISIVTDAKILAIDSDKSMINLNNQVLKYGHLFNCAGLHADSIAHQYDIGKEYRILPFKGLYWRVKKDLGISKPVNLYPVPDLNVPFLGVHFTPNTESFPQYTVGPTATPALGRENYKLLEKLEPKAALFTITTIAKQYIMNKNNFRDYVHQQAPLAFSPLLLRAARELIPSIQRSDLELSDKVGIRSQLYNLHKEKLENDFICERANNSTHILNAISPAFTASFELADLIIDKAGY